MEKYIELLKNNPNVDEYKLISNKVSSTELFFIKDELQMNRAKDVIKFNVIVYKNFTENGKKYKGSSSTTFSNVYKDQEIEDKINQAALAASFVKNEYYDLVSPVKTEPKKTESKFSKGNPVEIISKLVKDIYDEDNQFNSFINSSEFFLNKNEIRIINSKGVDVTYEKYSGEIELITESNGEKESIELFSVLHFADYDKEAIKKEIKDKLEQASLRAKAIPMPNIENVPVLLRGASTIRLWNYYLTQASGSQKYQHIHNNNIGDIIQSKDSKGSLVTITLKPVIPNSTLSSYYDADGFLMKETELIKEGEIVTLSASKRFSDYLNIPTTGNLQNVIVEPGNYSEEEFKSGPYLEIIAFSNFQMNPITGDFGGEFRLALYNDGEKVIPVTLGSITGNIKTEQNEMFLSSETVKNDHFIGPKYIKFNTITIVGN